jgi:hypothetical protein
MTDRDSVTLAQEADRKRDLLRSVTQLGDIESQLDQFDRLLTTQRDRLAVLQHDFTGDQRTALAVVLSGLPANVPLFQVALTLDDGSTTARAAGVAIMAVSVGVIPVVAARAADVADPDVRAYMQQFGARPSFWTALGRDGATLARAAIRALPLDTITNPAAIAQRRSLVQFRVGAATARLWTAEATGFAGGHAIKRKLRVADLPR